MKGSDMQGVEIKFAQKLAGNDKEGRDKALKKLKKWIELRSQPDPTESVYSEVDLLKLWKGLFFCMWMSDKPLVQELLAEELSRLVHLFPRRDDGVTFTDTFFITMAREWNGIDNIRKDKFMMLVRRVLRQSLQLAADAGWEGAVPEQLLAVYRRAFARPEEPASLPLGLQLHCVDIYLEEVAKVSRGGITAPQLAALLQPFVELLKVSKDSRLVSAVTDGVFFHLMRQSDLGIAHDAVVNGEVPLESDDDDEEEESTESEAVPPGGENPLDPRAGGVDVTLPQLPLDCTQLSERLMEAGSDPSVRQKNRETLYRLAAQFRDLEEGTYPLAVKLPAVVESDSDLSDEDVQAAVQRLKKSQSMLKEEHASRRKRRRGATDDDVTAETTSEPEPTEPEPKKRKKVRNKVATANGIIDTGERLLSEAERAAEAVAEAASPKTSLPLTAKEKRKHRLEAVKVTREKKLEQKKRCQGSRQAVVNGTEAAHEGNGVSGPVENGAVPDTPLSGMKKKGRKNSASECPADKSSAAEHNGQQVQTNKIRSLKKQKKNKLDQNNESINGNHVAVSSPPVSSPKKKKKKARSGASETSETSSSPLNGKAPESPSKEHQANGICEVQLRSKDQKKPKKSKRTAGAAGDVAGEAPSSGAATRAQTSPLPGATDWAVPAADDWGELAPGEVEFFVPSKKAVQKAAAAAGKASPLAKFVPSKPTAVFAKTRGSPKAGKVPSQKSPPSPITPKRKKLKICLNKNMEQTFKEHLITVRNSPGVPHNPQIMPTKGLLKTPVSTPVKQVKTYQKKAAAPQQPRRGRRSHAADFFNQ